MKVTIKQEKQFKKRRTILFTTSIAATILIVAVIVGMRTKEIRTAYNYNEVGQYYVDVTEGITLWDIAQEISTEKQDVRKTIEIIKELNNIKDNTITKSQLIDIPIFVNWEHEEQNKVNNIIQQYNT